MEKHLPHNIDAERGILGSILIDPEAIDEVSDTLKADHFYRDSHRTIYEVIRHIHASREVPDIITICDELERRNKLEDVGGFAYLSGLVNDVPTSGHVKSYASIVIKAAGHRRLIHAAGKIAAIGYEQGDDAVAEAEKILFNLTHQATRSGLKPISEIMADYMQELGELQEHPGELTGVTTGYRELDRMFNGLQKADLIILAGRPGSGKTALAANIVRNAAGAGHRIAIFSLEMSNRQLARRLISMESDVDMRRLGNGFIQDHEWESIAGAAGTLADLPIWICDASDSPVSSIRAQLRRMVQERGGVDLVLVDYLQLMDPDQKANGKGYENRVAVISEISRGLKGLAKDFNVPIIALAQLSREVEKRPSKIPVLADLRESGSIEADADIVMMLYRDDYYAALEQRESERPNIADVYISKNRQGETGMVSLYFKADQTKFYKLERQEAE